MRKKHEEKEEEKKKKQKMEMDEFMLKLMVLFSSVKNDRLKLLTHHMVCLPICVRHCSPTM